MELTPKRSLLSDKFGMTRELARLLSKNMAYVCKHRYISTTYYIQPIFFTRF